MKVSVLALLFNFTHIQTWAFEPWYGSSINGLAGISTFNVYGVNPYYNPAQFQDSIKYSFNFSHTQINGLSGIAANHLGITKQNKTGSYSILAANYGTFGYQEFKIGFATGLKVNSKLNIGIHTLYNHISIIGNGRSNSISSNISLNSTVFKDNIFTAICDLPFQFKNSDFNQIPETPILKLGWCNHSGKKLKLLAEMCLSTVRPLVTRFGICYQNQILKLLFGFEPKSKIIGFGLGLSIKKTLLAISHVNHFGLGHLLSIEANYVKH
ncbi:MAG TPA: hypothetical protein VGF79_11115 [Bacteroidia bacterium]